MFEMRGNCCMQQLQLVNWFGLTFLMGGYGNLYFGWNFRKC